MTIFVAVQAPELVSRDLRSRVLPLYFSRPIEPADYPLAKYVAFTAACLVMIEVPLLLLYVGTIVNVHGGAAVWAQTRALIPGLLVGLMWAVLLAAIGLLLASLTGRRAFATGAVAIFCFLTYTLRRSLTDRERQVVVHRGRRHVGRHRGRGRAIAEKAVRPVQPVHPVRRRAACGSAARSRPTACRPGALRRGLRADPARARRGAAWPAWPPATGRRACHDHHRADATSAAGTATWWRSTTSR